MAGLAGLRLLLALLVVAAAQEAPEACDSEASCGAALRRDEDGESALELLQLQVAGAGKSTVALEGYSARRARLRLLDEERRHEDPKNAEDEGFAWDQATKAVQIENLTEHLSQATDELKEKLQEQLAELRKQCPGADQIKRGLRGDWEKVRKAVALEEVQEKLQKAKDFGSERYEQLKAQYDDLMKEVDVGEVKRQFYHQWDELAEFLPGLDRLREGWGQAWGQATEAAHRAWDVVSGWMR